MLRERVTIDEVIALLNELAKIDRDAVDSLINARVNCSPALVDHPTVQVQIPDGFPGPTKLGVLGVLNGLFGVGPAGYGPIAARFYDDGQLACFERLPTKVGD